MRHIRECALFIHGTFRLHASSFTARSLAAHGLLPTLTSPEMSETLNCLESSSSRAPGFRFGSVRIAREMSAESGLPAPGERLGLDPARLGLDDGGVRPRAPPGDDPPDGGVVTAGPAGPRPTRSR